MKVNYFSNILDENKHDIKNTWSILRCILGKQNDKSSYPSTFTINNTATSNKCIASESFNSYFSHIGLSTSQNVPTSKKSHFDYLTNSTPESMYMEPVSPSTVIATAIKLKPKTSSGIDEISTKLLKDTDCGKGYRAHYLYNKAIREAKYLARHMTVLGNVLPLKSKMLIFFS